MSAVSEFVRPVARRIAAIPGRIIPYEAQKPMLSLALNGAFRQPLRNGELEFLQGARVRVVVADLCVDWLIRVDRHRFTPINRDGGHDVVVTGTSLDFLLLAARRADPDALFFQRRIRIEGDTELGLGVKNTMDSMDWDDLPVPLKKLLQGVGMLLDKWKGAGAPA
jgi:predicted lipid carrier protein YhbT